MNTGNATVVPSTFFIICSQVRLPTAVRNEEAITWHVIISRKDVSSLVITPEMSLQLNLEYEASSSKANEHINQTTKAIEPILTDKVFQKSVNSYDTKEDSERWQLIPAPNSLGHDLMLANSENGGFVCLRFFVFKPQQVSMPASSKSNLACDRHGRWRPPNTSSKQDVFFFGKRCALRSAILGPGLGFQAGLQAFAQHLGAGFQHVCHSFIFN
ncbi:hypothetical protein CEXT_641921 [Caerostris extrusa]|uniref:Uncharacterized protein n=1 Tax=Caerostris extrusa TaxID=172846 RepID=A0AAV4NCP0_CAEEX|nr:hypothetical protein CEXT_641921 [Caerostris extrusa]